MKSDVYKIIKKDTPWIDDESIEKNYWFIVNNLLDWKILDQTKNIVLEQL